MFRFPPHLPLILLLSSAACGYAAHEPLEVPDGRSLLGETALDGLVFTGGRDERLEDGRRRATVKEVPQNPWSVQYVVDTAAPVAKGDVLLLVLTVRCVEVPGAIGGDDQAHLRAVFERNGDPWDKSLNELLTVENGRTQTFHLPFRAGADFEAGGAHLTLPLGMRRQTIEIHELRLLNYGRDYQMEDLPRTSASYAGRDQGAQWRRDARERIARLRQGDLLVRVVDANGRAVPAAMVRARLTRHAFAFGTAINTHFLTKDGGLQAVSDPDRRAYLQHLRANFSDVVFEDRLKWRAHANGRVRDQTMAVLGFLNAMDMRVRGHVLVWPSWRHMPDEVAALKDDPRALAAAVDEHIRSFVGATRGWVGEWDVVNEPFSNHDLMDVLGDEAMAGWFRLAHQLDPDIRLFINDYGILSTGGHGNHPEHYYRTIKQLLDQGAPLHAIGMQGHFGNRPIAPEQILRVLDRFAEFKLPIRITEYDIGTDDEELAGDYLRDLLIACYSHESVDGFLMWGFWDGRHWHGKAPLFRRDWTPKPALAHWRRLIYEEWHTDETALTDAQGACRIRGHAGEYEVTITYQGRRTIATAVLSRDGGECTVQMPTP